MIHLSSFFNNLRWQDLIDIGLASYILFRFYIIFRGTYVFRVISGLGLLWIFQRLTSSIGLIVTSWALQGITAVAAIIIIVVFRNELRQVLQARNIRTILWGVSSKPLDTPIEVIVKAVFELKKKHLGALMVFPGKEDLGTIIQKGIPWKGRLSKEMLVSIFWPDNPVHDGAAIISGDQVTEVGVILPLSSREDLPSYYGTRHRAAAGLVEITDALVLVVSEERGTIVAAQQSTLSEVPNDLKLIRILQEHMGSGAVSASFWFKKKIKHSLTALFSILFISTIWFSFTQGLDTLITLEIPIEYMNRNPQMEIMNTSINTVNLNLSGSGPLIKSIQPQHIHARLDLAKAVAGLNAYTLTPENITLPPGVILKTIHPQKVVVTLDALVKKELPVQVDWSGTLPENLILERVKCTPESVIVGGGSLALKKMTTIYTRPIRLENIRESGLITIGLVLDDKVAQIEPGSADKILVEYKIKKRLEPVTTPPAPEN
ncbi:MAG: DisA protein [Desulfobacteraceae bacterium]|nr:MAG: DisA protein [Desulfobacteraceae bacterium]